MNIKDFKNKKITIMGLGLHGGGAGAAKFFSQAGARVLATDLRNKEELKESLEKLKGLPIKFVLGQHRSEDFINTDLVVKNPAVSEKSKYLQLAQKNKAPIDTDVGIFFELCPAPIIGVTGTKGKSTTASLIAKMLAQKYSKVILAGNIRASVLEKLSEIDKNSLVVLELSSWQLAGLRPHRKSPGTAVITNIMPDHLNRYQTMAEYIEDKKCIFKWQKSKNYLILNYDDKIVRELNGSAKSQVIYFTAENGPLEEIKGGFVKGDKIFLKKEAVCSLEDINLAGQHNLNNVLAAVTTASLYGVSAKSIKKALKKFKGLEGRLEIIAQINGVKYINDTTATTPEAVLAGLNSFSAKQGIILIAGGADKNLDFSQLAEKIVKKVKGLLLLPGTATDKIETALEKIASSEDAIRIIKVSQMSEAVQEASKLAATGDIVLLSSGAASFGLFRHEFERGEEFKKAVSLLKNLESGI
ncbi:MAG: UDP-N-acetylmuramoylalanine--D-glutamate ligase [Candidatus Portnoybacteria bacterium RIFCSPLOWO2_12_FULL_39_9]|uniref:UDP-N-acetylmuramoylalanine--D-glutamate ligase n=1 Tax=Candidatus Portnoybacteria bacterium RIFCSPHIGHO2_12_FULL_38_9 TaxID=1801997 RepID=A0A1G2FHR9_9BACT|nr:MAG: UDP-N-acetylmuramoylalanine--D-glutamate ligase [Candidatus Portnoybacteria bacterium RIFCSPHIGHO2_02_FULL_39_12]OGZ37387.1 MAG: UDP-N-acetylmuramoylalanine--D-glutamate ligase [Candidatus Portnoybacteria bacterium RIFCSPHIGHO2_12_FULL_38_9]OGZ39200.1 MAG: UDP-N-acetylmuramoylalanine--D-glutamate ligase [Candidatus Portnoybacteria bacterium RIFCSPLOWO2_01_FULL_38_39]OGZ40723.1 MAG: UDP-N-acetylmuramoylalanine--D-glutamate ligase [Candidatus Portnoybacteria bacterium RIFCSPLOWO2_12_FULL_3